MGQWHYTMVWVSWDKESDNWVAKVGDKKRTGWRQIFDTISDREIINVVRADHDQWGGGTAFMVFCKQPMEPPAPAPSS